MTNVITLQGNTQKSPKFPPSFGHEEVSDLQADECFKYYKAVNIETISCQILKIVVFQCKMKNDTRSSRTTHPWHVLPSTVYATRDD